MIDWKFTAIAVALAGLLSATAWPFVQNLPGGTAGLLAGAGFSLVSFLVVHHWVLDGARQGGGAFTTAVLGGFLARMLALLAFAVVLGLTSGVHVPTALLTIVVAHFVVSPIEFVHLDRTRGLR